MNKFKKEIYDYTNKIWVDYTKYAILPIKGAGLLDEQLDEFELQLARTNTSIFLPQTEVRLTITSTSKAKYTEAMFEKVKARCDTPNAFNFIYNQNKTITVERVINMFIASDNATQRPIGKRKYNHELYLIELTKLLESYICDSITFTNPLGSNYTQTQINLTFSLYLGNAETNNFNFVSDEQSNYLIPINAKSSYNIITDPYQFIKNQMNVPGLLDNMFSSGDGVFITNPTTNENIYKKYVGTDGNIYQQIKSEQPTKIADFSFQYIPWEDYQLNFQQGGIYQIQYLYGSVGTTYKAVALFSVAENRLPPKKWTITEVINRILELAKPLRGAERPNIRLSGVEYETDEDGYSSIITPFASGSLAERLDKILAPEFSLTKMTLREQLQAVGGFIHGEPRLTGKTTDSDGNEYFILDFDFYGNRDFSHIKKTPFITNTKSININDYCTSLDSSVDNLVNQLDYANGVIIEPFENGDKSIRSDTVAVRLEESDGTAFIDTAFPIFLKPKVTAIWQGEEYDISPYIYEITDYNNLNSYKGTYPYAKAYALYYTQGQKSIQGLFFKAPDAVDAVFKKYAISNILSTVTGTNIDFATTINNKELINTDSLLNLTFRVEYLPISSARVKTNKSIVVDGLPRTLAYNQSANTIESRYFGENLKGVIARLGNVEKQITYALPFISDIPKEGLKFNEDYYISAVSTEYLSTYCKCTVGLTKHFNRQSEYIGINSIKRMWEVSEKQTQERQTVLNEYLLIKESSTAIESDEETLFSLSPLSVLATEGEQNQFVSAGVFRGYTKNGNAVNSNILVMPAISSAFGNALSFTCIFEDNYSAGKTIVKENNNAYSSYSQYTDYYGRIYYLELAFVSTLNSAMNANANALPILQDLTLANLGDNIVSTGNKRIKYRKDNREIPTISYELQAVTDGSIIIGSALMRNCAFVNKSPKKISIGYFRTNLNVISPELNLDDLIEGDEITEIDFDYENGVITLPNKAIEHTSWAIFTNGKYESIQAVDDNGNAVTQSILTGFELVIGQNKPARGQKIAFALKSDIYSKT